MTDDTHPKIKQFLSDQFAARTGEERLKMGCSMYDFSKKLVEASIVHNNPTISEKDLRKEIFIRFYKNDFSSPALKKILDAL